MRSKRPLGIQVWLAGVFTLLGCVLLALHVTEHPRRWVAIAVAAGWIVIGLWQVVYHYRQAQKVPPER